jgi:soluble lytic murein transglycosylase-like protein
MTLEAIILAAAKSVGVPGFLLLAICTQESGLKNIKVSEDHGSPSYGVCMVKRATAKFLGFQDTAKELMDPHVNARYAAKYLKYQLDRYNGNICKSTAAYNSGTYSEGKIPGKPRNLMYIKYVQSRMDQRLRHKLECETGELAEE